MTPSLFILLVVMTITLALSPPAAPGQPRKRPVQRQVCPWVQLLDLDAGDEDIVGCQGHGSRVYCRLRGYYEIVCRLI